MSNKQQKVEELERLLKTIANALQRFQSGAGENALELLATELLRSSSRLAPERFRLNGKDYRPNGNSAKDLATGLPVWEYKGVNPDDWTRRLWLRSDGHTFSEDPPNNQKNKEQALTTSQAQRPQRPPQDQLQPQLRTVDGPPQYCRGALERGEPLHTIRTYATLEYSDGRRYHFCDEHPPRPGRNARDLADDFVLVTADGQAMPEIYLHGPGALERLTPVMVAAALQAAEAIAEEQRLYGLHLEAHHRRQPEYAKHNGATVDDLYRVQDKRILAVDRFRGLRP